MDSSPLREKVSQHSDILFSFAATAYK